MGKYFYTYYSYEEFGRGYIGKRECECLPEKDIDYLGSFKDKTFKPTQKIILETFDTVEEALGAECILHDFYEVDINPHFANKAKQTSTKFYYSCSGESNSSKRPEVREKARISKLGDKNPAKRPEVRQKLKEARNKRITTDETKKKMSEAHKGRPGTYGMKDKEHSEETKKRMRENRVNRNNKIWKIKDPFNIVHVTDNLKSFCEQNNLTGSAIHHVISGKRNHHKGWTRA
jgi:hypothetical protein